MRDQHTLIILFTIWVYIHNLKKVIEKKLAHPSKSIRCVESTPDQNNSLPLNTQIK